MIGHVVQIYTNQFARRTKSPCCNVRCGSLADICSAKTACPLYPNSGHVQCNSRVRFVPIADISMATGQERCFDCRSGDGFSY